MALGMGPSGTGWRPMEPRERWHELAWARGGALRVSLGSYLHWFRERTPLKHIAEPGGRGESYAVLRSARPVG
jgi:hypothetical protein